MTKKWSLIAIIIIASLLLIVAIPTSYAAQNQEKPAQQAVLFFDDFNGSSIDTTKWVPGLHQWGGANNGVVPENLSVHSYNDNGTTISVLDTVARGTQYTGPVRGIKSTNGALPIGDPARYTVQPTGQITGGLVWTVQRYGGGRYEVRMKNLPGPYGCSCIWNYYEPGGNDYTEIDIEMPAHMNPAPAWTTWQRMAGLNSYWPSPTDADATYINKDTGVNQYDGQFHVYRWDWYDGTNGPKRVDWYIDGVLQASTTQHVPSSSAQFWVGNWPAQWPGMNYNFNTANLYIDWVRITALGGTNPTNTPTRTPTPTSTAGGPTATRTPTQPGGTERIVNGTFEGGNTNGWTCSGNTGAVSGQGFGSTYALRLTPSASTTSRCQQTVSGLTPGQSYTVSGMLKSTSGAWIYLGVNGFYESGTTGNSYVSRSVTFTPTTSSVTVYVSAWMQQTGDTYADNISLPASGGGGGPTATPTKTNTPVPTNTSSPATNLLGNPGFETGALSPWASWNNSVVTGNSHSGTYSMRVGTAEGSGEQTVTGLQPNTTYILSGWVKTSATSVTGNIGAKNFGGSQVFTSTTSTGYVKLQITFTTGASNTSALVYCYKPTTSGYIYCDDMSLTKQ